MTRLAREAQGPALSAPAVSADRDRLVNALAELLLDALDATNLTKADTNAAKAEA